MSNKLLQEATLALKNSKFQECIRLAEQGLNSDPKNKQLLLLIAGALSKNKDF